jgi:hypothetical protein
MTEAFISIGRADAPKLLEPLGVVNTENKLLHIPEGNITIFHNGFDENGAVVVSQENKTHTIQDTILRRILPHETQNITEGTLIIRVEHT